MAKKFYAVKKGITQGIFNTWDECKSNVEGVTGAQYKSFKTKQEAEDYLNGVTQKETVSNKANTSENKAIKHSNHPILNEGEVIAYTDGSFLKDKNYSYAYLILDSDGSIAYEDAGPGTSLEALKLNNVAGELMAVIKLIQFVTTNNNAISSGIQHDQTINFPIKKIYIYHDYLGVAHWVTGEWKAKNEITQWYRDFMQKYSHLCEFIHVKGHSDNVYNDRVDVLAKQVLGIK